MLHHGLIFADLLIYRECLGSLILIVFVNRCACGRILLVNSVCPCGRMPEIRMVKGVIASRLIERLCLCLRCNNGLINMRKKIFAFLELLKLYEYQTSLLYEY